MRVRAITLAAMLIVAGLAAPVAASMARQEGYSGAHVAFGTQSDAVVDYTVDGQPMAESIRVQSKSAAESSGGIDVSAGLSAVTNLGGAAVTLETSASASAATAAQVGFDSGASMDAHDNRRGVFVVRAGENAQYAQVALGDGASADADGENRVVVTNADGAKGTFIVVGDGEVTTNENGDVVADLDQGAKLVFRSYPDGRDDEDAEQERLIADGTAAAEVYVSAASEGGEQAGETAVDVVRYAEDTSVEVTERSAEAVRMTVDRTERSGRVVIVSATETAFATADAADDVTVTVDGEAAVRASSYSELTAATQDGDTSKYVVRQSSAAEGSADVLVGINHFSSRDVAVQGSGDGSGSGDDGGFSGVTGPGFGVLAAMVALAAAALLVRRD